MAKALNETWQVCDAVIDESIREIANQGREDIFDLGIDMDLDRGQGEGEREVMPKPILEMIHIS